jgi:putative transposase
VVRVHQAYRFELDPSWRARSAMSSHTGASRFAFNWGLALVKSRLELRERIRSAGHTELLSDEGIEALVRTVRVPWTLISLRQEWNRVKRDVAPWWGENSKEAYNSGLDALARALGGFSRARSGERAGTTGIPRFKKKWAKKSCRFTTGAIKVVDLHHVQLPRIGVIRTKENTDKLLAKASNGRARILSATISCEAGRWFVSFTCEVERDDTPARHLGSLVAVDLGISHLATLSNGQVVENPRALSRYQRRMKRLAKEVLRRQRGSNRRKVATQKLARCHARVAHIRADAIGNLTTDLASTYRTVVIEDLAVKNMTASPKPAPDPEHPGAFLPNGARAKAGLNKALLDVSPAEFRRQLTYKLTWRGGTLVVADRWFASSKTCSRCQTVKTKLSLRERTYSCERCNLVLDRDLNAALNLAAYGRQVLSHPHHDVAVSGTETKNGRGRDTTPASCTGSGSRAKRQDGSGQPAKADTASPTGEAA